MIPHSSPSLANVYRAIQAFRLLGQRSESHEFPISLQLSPSALSGPTFSPTTFLDQPSSLLAWILLPPLPTDVWPFMTFPQTDSGGIQSNRSLGCELPILEVHQKPKDLHWPSRPSTSKMVSLSLPASGSFPGLVFSKSL